MQITLAPQALEHLSIILVKMKCNENETMKSKLYEVKMK